MPSKKKASTQTVNVDKLFDKVSQMGKELDSLQSDVSQIAVDVLKLLKHKEQESSLISRIKSRLGL